MGQGWAAADPPTSIVAIRTRRLVADLRIAMSRKACTPRAGQQRSEGPHSRHDAEAERAVLSVTLRPRQRSRAQRNIPEELAKMSDRGPITPLPACGVITPNRPFISSFGPAAK